MESPSFSSDLNPVIRAEPRLRPLSRKFTLRLRLGRQASRLMRHARSAPASESVLTLGLSTICLLLERQASCYVQCAFRVCFRKMCSPSAWRRFDFGWSGKCFVQRQMHILRLCFPAGSGRTEVFSQALQPPAGSSSCGRSARMPSASSAAAMRSSAASSGTRSMCTCSPPVSPHSGSADVAAMRSTNACAS